MITTEWENVYFHSHVNIKNIIGKELINDDNVAVMELVKNSYDAGAKTVHVEFRNLKNENINNELFIVDDGNGMSKEDILQKWLNLAYSIKRVQKNCLTSSVMTVILLDCMMFWIDVSTVYFNRSRRKRQIKKL